MLRIKDLCRSRHVLTVAALAVCVLLLSCRGAAAQSSFQGTGYVQDVDPQHKKITFTDGSALYTIDTSHSAIHLPALGATPGETGDLVSGMRIRVIGTSIGVAEVKAVRLQVLPYVPPTQIAAVVPAAPIQPPAPPTSPPVKLLENLSPSNSTTAPTPSEQVITGTVSAEASLFNRDIKVATEFGESKVSVPRGIDIEIDGKPSSVHDLKKNMTIEVYGTQLPDDNFQANRILSTAEIQSGG